MFKFVGEIVTSRRKSRCVLALLAEDADDIGTMKTCNAAILQRRIERKFCLPIFLVVFAALVEEGLPVLE